MRAPSLSIVLILLCTAPGAAVAAAREGQLELAAIDRDTGKPITVRVHLTNVATKKPVKPPGVPALGDHFVFYDRIRLTLPLGSYRFVMERGPEYLVRTGHFTINNYADDRQTVDMKRFVDMAAEGWYAGDLDVRRSDREIEMLMHAEDLYLATLVKGLSIAAARASRSAGETSPAKITQKHEPVQFDGSRFYSPHTGEDARGGSAFLAFALRGRLQFPAAESDIYPSSLTLAASSRQAGAWIDAAQPFSWDLPLWAAAGKLDSVQLAHRHLMQSAVVNHEAGGRQRDPALYPGVQGNGRWSSDIYYHLLNCGLRLPPTAGSGSGWQPHTTAAAGTTAAYKAAAAGNTNPVGYNRVYVFVDGDLTWQKWWEGLRAGRAVVTNGPLIRPSVEGQPPGYVFPADRGESVELEIGLTLSTRDKISYLEVVKNGATEHTARLDQWKENGGKLPPLKFSESGWFLVRAVCDEASTYRYATTAPYYVEIGYQPRISRTSAQFFVDWCQERIKQITDAQIGNRPHAAIAAEKTSKAALTFATEQKRDEVLGYWRRAEEFWTAILKRANVP